MAPTVRSSAGHGSTAAASSHNVPLPAGYQSGDLLILGLQYRQSVSANAISGGTLLDAGTIYDSTSAMGSVSGATILPPEAQR